MNIIGTALPMKMCDMVSLNRVFFVTVSPGLPGRSGECVDNHSVGDDDTHNLGHIRLNGTVDDRRGHRQDSLEEDRADDDIRDIGLVDAGASDENRGNSGKCHKERSVVELDKPEALLKD